jgi:hypothetical protein
VDVPLLFLILGPKSDQPPAHDGPLRHSTS